MQAVAPHTRKTESGGKTARKRRPADQWAPPIAVPAVVDEATWVAVQDRLARNKALALRNAHQVYLLSGLLRCERCGHPLTGHSKGGHRYYHCSHRGTYYNRPLEPHEQCDTPWVRADRLEDAVWTRVADLFRDPERFREELARRRDEGSPTRTAAEEERAALGRRLAVIPGEQDRLVHAFTKGRIPEDAMGRAMDGLQKERLAALGRVASLERELANLALSERQEADALEYAARVGAGLDGLDDEGRQRFLRDMVRQVHVDGRRVMIRTILPGGPDGGGSGGTNPVTCHIAPTPSRPCAAGHRPSGGPNRPPPSRSRVGSRPQNRCTQPARPDRRQSSR